MRTIPAYFRYDWRGNAVRHLALLALAIGSFWVPFAFGLGDELNHDGEPLFQVAAAGFGGCYLAALLLLVGTTLGIGRDGSPLEPRYFTHTLPLRRGAWAMGKLLCALVWVGLVPVLGLAVSIGMIQMSCGAPLWAVSVSIVKLALSLLPVSAAFTMWMLLCAALLPNRWGLVGLMPFALGEALARGLTSFPGLTTRNAPIWSAGKTDAGLLVILVVALASVFVCYQQRRGLRWAVLAALAILGCIDGLRALLW